VAALTSKLFNVVDAEGEHLFICADSILQAYQGYKTWWLEGHKADEWVEPESIIEAGDLISRSLE
jgi:hypothetical protein